MDNSGYAASLEVGKLYRVIPDTEAAKHGYIRVIDESGEDYGYSTERFFLLEIPEALSKVLSARADRHPNPTALPSIALRSSAERLSRQTAAAESQERSRSHR
jgi:hypothetical protein